MHIVTWNINGLRAIAQKGFADWFVAHSPDIIALQEIKAQNSDVEHLIALWSEHYEIYLYPALKKGYSGTALLIKKHLKPNVHFGIEDEKFDCEGRLIWCECADFYLFNGYFPNGKEDLSRVDYKLEFSRKVLKLALLKSKIKPVIITGDLNTAHTEIDLARPKANIKNTGFLPRERAFLDEMISAGLYDAFRVLYPNLVDQYTWWSYRGGAREKNVGWRLDYFFIDERIKNKLKEVKHLTEVHGSDHCPVEIKF